MKVVVARFQLTFSNNNVIVWRISTETTNLNLVKCAMECQTANHMQGGTIFFFVFETYVVVCSKSLEEHS